SSKPLRSRWERSRSPLAARSPVTTGVSSTPSKGCPGRLTPPRVTRSVVIVTERGEEPMKKYIAAGTVTLAALFGTAACSAEPETEPETVEQAPVEEPTPEPGPIVPEPETDTDSAGPAEVVAPPIENFNGASAEVYPFQVYV